MENIYQQIGNKIKELRQSYGNLSQEDLAKSIKVTSNTVSRWETAVYKPSVEDIQKIAKFFGVSISLFFPDIENPKLQALMSATGNLDQKDIEELIEYANYRKIRQVLASKKSKSNS